MTEPIIIALIGVAGAIVGSIATLAGNFLLHWMQDRSKAKMEEPARELLREMLNQGVHFGVRSILFDFPLPFC